MDSVVERFNESFHNLDGVTIGEKRKSLFKLLDETSKNPQQHCLDNLIASIVPTDNLEEAFRVQILARFKRVPELLEILKTENWILISQVLKQKWFFGRLTSDYDPEFLMSLFGQVSFVVRMKMINRIASNSNNTNFVDRLYDQFVKKYGVENSTYLLCGCSPKRIREVLSKHDLALSSGVLLKFAKKDPDLVEYYADLCERNGNRNFHYNDESAMFYLITNDLEAFCKIYEKHKNTVRCGMRTTRRLVSAKRGLILRDSLKCSSMLNKKGLIKGLRDDFLQFYCNILPEDVRHLPKPLDQDRRYSFLERFRKSTRFKIVEAALKNKWNTSLSEIPELMSPKMVDEFFRPEDRIRFAKSMLLRDDKKEGDWITRLGIEEAFQLIKHRISLTSEKYERRDLINMLVQTCAVNRNEPALIDVCKYFLSRHRNDDKAIKMWFLSEIMDNFQTETLGDEQWKHLDEIMKLIRSTESYYYDEDRFLAKSVLRCLIQALPPNDFVKEFCKNPNNYDKIKCPKRKFEKDLLLLLYDLIPNVFVGKIVDLQKADLKLFALVIKFNKNQHFDKADFNKMPRLEVSLKQDVNCDDVTSKDATCNDVTYVLEHIICVDKNFFDKQLYIDMYFRRCKQKGSEKINTWLLRNRPFYLSNNIGAYISAKNHAIVEYYFCKKYSYLGIPEMLITRWKNVLEKDDGIEEDYKESIKALTVLSDAESLAKIICKYYPKQPKIDVLSEEVQSTYNIQRLIASNLKHSIPPSDALLVLLNFCLGDYLRSALESLYYLFHHTPEHKLKPTINKLSKSAVSVRKHAIMLVRKVSSRQATAESLKKLIENETDPSVRKYLLKTAISFFKRNACDELWQLLQSNIAALDRNDEEAFDFVVDNKLIPPEYAARYTESVWGILKTNEERGSILSKQKFRLINNIDPKTVDQLSENFSNKILHEFFVPKSGLIENFAVFYIVHGPRDQSQNRSTLILSALAKFKDEDPKGLHSYVHSLCIKAIECNCKEFFCEFAQNWNEFFAQDEAFEEYLLLRIALTHFEALQEGYDKFGSKLAYLIDTIVSDHGMAVVDMLSVALGYLIWTCLHQTKNDEDAFKMAFIKSLFQTTDSTATALVAISLITELSLDLEDVCKKSSIFGDLRRKSEPVVHVYIGNYLNNMIVY